jgi:hypothetical protein
MQKQKDIQARTLTRIPAQIGCRNQTDFTRRAYKDLCNSKMEPNLILTPSTPRKA